VEIFSERKVFRIVSCKFSMGEKSSASVAADFLQVKTFSDRVPRIFQRVKTLPHRPLPVFHRVKIFSDRPLRIFDRRKLRRMIRRKFSTGENSTGSFAADF
jgi:hypothetical protein